MLKKHLYRWGNQKRLFKIVYKFLRDYLRAKRDSTYRVRSFKFAQKVVKAGFLLLQEA